MGLLWRLFAPRKLKKVRRAISPTQLIGDAIQPKALKRVRRAAYRTMNPVQGVEGLVGDIAVRGRGRKGKKRSSTPRPDGLPHRFTDAWIKKTVPRLSPTQVAYVIDDMRKRGWRDADLERRVYPYVRR